MPQPTPAALALAAAMIRVFEGCVLSPYWDPFGHVWSNGYGFCTSLDGTPVTAHTSALSQTECEALLEAKLAHEYVPGVLTACAGIALTDGQLAALSSFAWNEGVGRIQQAGLPATLRRNDLAKAATVMRLYNVAGGRVLDDLVRRRAAEAAVLCGASWPTPGFGGTLAHPVQQQTTYRPLSPGMQRPAGAIVSRQQSVADDGTAALNDAELSRIAGGG